MFGSRYWGNRYYGGRYWGHAGETAAAIAATGGVKAGTFVQKDSAGTQSITGLGFQPTAIIFYSSGVTSSSSYADHMNAMLGMTAGTGATDSGSVSTSSEDAKTTGTHNSTGRAAQKAITFCEFSDLVKSEADLDSFDSDGFTLDWTLADNVGRIINFIAVSGFDSVKIIEWQLNGSSGDQTVSGVGFTPDAVFSIWEQNDNLNSTPYVANDGGIGIGAFNSTTAWGMGTFDEEGNDTTTRRAQSNVDMWAGVNLAGTARYVSFVEMNSDGFKVNVDSNFTPECIVYSLCLKGGPRIAIGNISKPNSQTGSVVESVGFAPGGVLLASARVTAAKTTMTGGAQLSVGASDEDENQNATEWFVVRAATSDSAMINIADRCILMNSNNDATVESQGQCELFTDDGFSIDWGASSGLEDFLSYIAFESLTSDLHISAAISTMSPLSPSRVPPSPLPRMDTHPDWAYHAEVRLVGPQEWKGMSNPLPVELVLPTALIKMEALQEEPGSDVLLESIDGWGPPLSIPFELEQLRTGGPNNDQLLSQIFDEVITVDKWFTPFTQNFHREVMPPIESFVFMQADGFGEEILLDKWYTPFTQNFHRDLIPPHESFVFERADGFAEEVLLDKWYTRLSEPNRLEDDVLYQALLTTVGVLDVLPIPELDLLPTRIPWYTPLSHEFRREEFAVIPPIESFVNLTTEEAVHADALFGKMAEPNPWALPSIIHLLTWPYPLGSIFTLETITIDKWYTPLSYEFRSEEMPIHLIEMTAEPENRDSENILLDKFDTPLSLPRRLTPWEEFGHLLTEPSIIDPEPIPDIPGVFDMVFSMLSLPIFPPPFWQDDWRRYENITIIAAAFLPFCPQPLARQDGCDTQEVSPQRPDQGFASGGRADELPGFPSRAPDCQDER